MLEAAFDQVYMKFKMHFYRGIFDKVNERKGSLSATEAFAVEIIYAMKRPTIHEFADFLNISQPNATYKVNALVKKGYIKKVKSDRDKREYFLEMAPKFYSYYSVNDSYIKEVMDRIKKRFSPEEACRFEAMLQIIANELMDSSSLDSINGRNSAPTGI